MAIYVKSKTDKIYVPLNISGIYTNKVILLAFYSQNYQIRLYKTSRHAITRQTQVQESTFYYSIFLLLIQTPY